MSNEKELLRIINNSPQEAQIFADGCFLIPCKLANGKWGWVVSSFEYDCFYDGTQVNVNELWSDTPQELIGEEDKDEEE